MKIVPTSSDKVYSNTRYKPLKARTMLVCVDSIPIAFLPHMKSI